MQPHELLRSETLCVLPVPTLQPAHCLAPPRSPIKE